MHRYSKALDRVCKDDTYIGEPFNQVLLDRIVAQHLVKEGLFASATTFSQEGQVPVDEALIAKFADMFRIKAHLANQQLDSALEWARAHTENTESVLEFSLVRLQYLTLMHQDASKCIAYARLNFPKFKKQQDGNKLFLMVRTQQITDCAAV